MTPPTALGAVLSKSGKEVQYDATCKRLISHKSILALILKSCIPEYQNCSTEEIIRYIESNPMPGVVCIDTDYTNPYQGEMIEGKSTEDVTMNEGTIKFDVLFDAKAPGKTGNILLTINVEAQNKFNPGYPLIKRAVFYCSRLISSQKEHKFCGSEYGKINKVYSIWLCMNPPIEYGAFINRYDVREHQVLGNAKFSKEDYDLLNVVMVGLNDTTSINPLVKVLSTVFSHDATLGDKRDVLEQNGIPFEGDIEEDLSSMCNLSQGVLEQGESNAFFKCVKSLMQNGIAFTDAVRMLDMSAHLIEFCKKELDITT